MAKESKLNEADNIIAEAMTEAQRGKHLHAGTDYIFLVMLENEFTTSRGVLAEYAHRKHEACTIVNQLNPKWILNKKQGRTRSNSGDGLARAKAMAIQIAHEVDGPDAEFTAVHLLEAILRLADSDSNLTELLRQLDIDATDLLAEIERPRELAVEN